MSNIDNKTFSMHVNAMAKEFVDLVVEFQGDVKDIVPSPFQSQWEEQMYVSDVSATAACSLLAFALCCIDNDDWDDLLMERMKDVKRMIKENQTRARASGIRADIKPPKSTAN